MGTDNDQQCTPGDRMEDIRRKWSEGDDEGGRNEDADGTMASSTSTSNTNRRAKRHRMPSCTVNDDRSSSSSLLLLSSSSSMSMSPSDHWLLRNGPSTLKQHQSSRNNKVVDVTNDSIVNTMILHEHLVTNPGDTVESLTHDVANWSLTRNRTTGATTAALSSDVNDPNTVGDDGERIRQEQQNQRRRRQCQNAKRQVFKALLGSQAAATTTAKVA